MKSKFLRILALILVMSSLLSMFTIFASAAGASATAKSGEAENGSFELMYNRTFDDDLDDLAGMTSVTGGTEFVVEENAGNKFLSMNLGVTSASGHDYAEITGASRGEIGSVIEFDIMVDAADVSANNPVSIHTTLGATEIDVLNIQANKVSFLGGQYADVFTMVPGTWYTIQVILDYEGAANANTFNLIIKHGEAGSNMKELTNEPISTQATSGNGVSLIRFQATGEDAGNKASVCFDNIKYYEGANEIVNITDEMGNGTILGGNGGTGSAGTEKDLAAALSMKVGVNYSYVNGARTPILTADGVVYGAPVNVGGQVMIPLSAVVDYVGSTMEMNGKTVVVTGTSSANLTVGSNVANAGNKDVTLSVAPTLINAGENLEYVVISLDDVNKLFPKYYTDYDNSGYIVVSTSADLLDREQNMSAMLSIMKKFVFDTVDADSIYNDVKEYTNFNHPYLLASGSDLERIRAEYNALKAEAEAGEIEDYSEEFWKLRNYYSIITAGEDAYQIYALKDGAGTYDTYAGIKALGAISSEYSLQQSNSNNLGYDASGRSDITNRTALLKAMTYAYVLTEDTKYLELSYEVAMYLGDWNHWGPGYFVNCADAASDFAIYYDWTYQGYVKLAQEKKRIEGGNYNVSTLAQILANQGVHEGYLSAEDSCDHISEKAPDINGSKAYSYLGRNDYWSAVSVSGMTLASLAVLDGNVSAVFTDEAKYVLSASITALMNKGLDLYAPDGSYEAGPAYWNYGTNSLFNMCAALESATGGNYGIMDACGIDATCYFAVHTEDNNDKYFAYHESSAGSYDTSYFFYVAKYFDDTTLAKFRYDQINSGLKNAGILDMIYYPAASDLTDSGEIELDYYAENADLFATRSGWEKDALFASMIGGKNNSTHGQMDAGNFVYHNGGIAWITDLGTENIYCKGLWDSATRYRYYVMKPEGNNTITITSDTKTPYGQDLSGVADAYKWGSNEYGSYVAYDMGKSLGTSVYKWERGMLLTNDRKTTVIQDQVDLANNTHTVYWFAHYNIDTVNGGVTISADGKTAYLRHYLGTNEHGEKLYQTLRLSIVTPSVSAFKFQVMSAYAFVNSNTYSASDVAALGGSLENSRDKYMKLAICGENINKFEVAVVIELVDDATIGTKSEIEVGYSFVKMSDAEWIPTADTRGLKVDNGDTIERRGTPNVKEHLYDSVMTIKQLAAKGTLYTDKIDTYFRAICDAYYAVRMIGSDMPKEIEDPEDPSKTINIKDDLLSVYNSYRKEFNAYRDAVINVQKTQRSFANSLMSLN